MPNHSKNLTIELCYGDDKIIGTGLYFLNKFKNLKCNVVEWVNIYGPPTTGIGKKFEKVVLNGTREGTCYRGRI